MTWKKKREGGVSVAARLIGNGHFHFGEHFVKAIVLVQIGRGIDGEWGVSVCVLSCLLSVDIHFYMLISTFKVEFHQFCSRGLEGGLAFSFAALKPAFACAGGSSGRVGSGVDVPIVW